MCTIQGMYKMVIRVLCDVKDVVVMYRAKVEKNVGKGRPSRAYLVHIRMSFNTFQKYQVQTGVYENSHANGNKKVYQQGSAWRSKHCPKPLFYTFKIYIKP